MSTLVILNSRAGTLHSGGLEDPQGVVANAFREAGREAEIRMVEPDNIGKCLDEARGSARFDTVIVGGGDGSFSHALDVLAGSGKILGLLPLGTMNLLGRDLGFPDGGLGEMAVALARGEAREVDLALINGQPFHTLCGIGYFSRVARQRELTRFNLPFGRALSVILSTLRSFLRGGRMGVEIEIDGRTVRGEAYAVLVTSNRIGNDWRRDRLDEGVLEVHVMYDANLVRRVRAGIELLSGSWRDGDSIESHAGERITIRVRRSRVWVAVDGELESEEVPLQFEIRKRAIRLLMPAAVTNGAALS